MWGGVLALLLVLALGWVIPSGEVPEKKLQKRPVQISKAAEAHAVELAPVAEPTSPEEPVAVTEPEPQDEPEQEEPQPEEQPFATRSIYDDADEQPAPALNPDMYHSGTWEMDDKGPLVKVDSEDVTEKLPIEPKDSRRKPTSRSRLSGYVIPRGFKRCNVGVIGGGGCTGRYIFWRCGGNTGCGGNTSCSKNTNPPAPDLTQLPVMREYYPRDKKEIEDEITRLLQTPCAQGADADQQAAINLANVYRYICGVKPSYVYKREYAAQALDAAKACQRANTLSHDLGHSTNLCNLAVGPATQEDTVSLYVDDPGTHNREARGHRAWLLTPEAGAVGFGQAGRYHGMRVMDTSSDWRPEGAYMYPGRGFFPARFMHGNGWAYYLPPGYLMNEKITVQMWYLKETPEKEMTDRLLAKAEPVPVRAVFPNNYYVVFEPDESSPTFHKDSYGRPWGIYWVRVAVGKRFMDEYLVEFY